MEAHFHEAEARVAQSQRELAEQQQATARMQQEWEVMKAEVSIKRIPSSGEHRAAHYDKRRHGQEQGSIHWATAHMQ